MFSIVSIELSGFSFGSEVAAIGQLGMGAGSVSKDQVSELIVPWQPLQKDAGVFSLLSWHSRVSDFDGRHNEMAELELWAESDLPVSVKFVVGDGGVGKSRLGAEFAEQMQDKKWSAGFVDLKNPRAFQMKKKGTLLVIDYPEEHTDKVKNLLHDLTTVGLAAKIRVLFLTRQTPERWEEVISLANARNIVDKNFMSLSRFEASSAKTIFDSTAKLAGEKLGNVGADGLGPAPIPEEAMEAWLQLAPVNQRALFVMAAAVHSAENPDDELVSYDSQQVVLALVDREVERYMRVAEKNGFQDTFVYARLAAIAAIAGDLSLDSIKGMINNPTLGLGLENATYLGQELERAGLLIEGRLVPPKPDILAAAFVVVVLGRTPKQAPEVVWTAISLDLLPNCERLCRIMFDAEVVLGLGNLSLGYVLSKAIEHRIDRSLQMSTISSSMLFRYGWHEVEISAYTVLLGSTKVGVERAALLNNLSLALDRGGRNQDALCASNESVEIYRTLAPIDPVKYESLLARTLNNLANRFGRLGEYGTAITYAEESVVVGRRLESMDSMLYGPDLAMYLSNFSNHLSSLGRHDDALSAARESVELRRELIKSDRSGQVLGLARGLNNLAIRLGSVGKDNEALEASFESVAIYRPLAEADPTAHAADCAICLSNLSTRLRNVGRLVDAKSTVEEALQIDKRLAVAQSAMFSLRLAEDLFNLGCIQYDLGESVTAAASFEQCIALYNHTTSQQFVRVRQNLARAREAFAKCCIEKGNLNEARAQLTEAIESLGQQSESVQPREDVEALIRMKDILGAIDRI